MSENTEILEFFSDLVYKEIGHIYNKDNLFGLSRRLESIATQMGHSNIEELYLAAKKGITPNLRLLLFDIATNHETLFFRNPKLFNLIKEIVLPDLLKNPQSRSLKVWSCASSTGQEPYSLAILFEKNIPLVPGGVYEILATDISPQVIEYGKKGIYSQLEVQRGLPFELLTEFFTKKDEGAMPNWEVASKLKSRIKFETLNLLHKWTLPKFSIIFCRNVLIYQNKESKKDIISRIHDSLIPGGYFVMGGSESLFGLTNDFEQINKDNIMIFKKKEKSVKIAS